MNTIDNAADVERGLAAITDWNKSSNSPQAAAGLWRMALEQVAPATANSAPFWQRRVGPSWVFVAASLFIVMLITVALLPAMGKARASSRSSVARGVAESAAPAALAPSDVWRGAEGRSLNRQGTAAGLLAGLPENKGDATAPPAAISPDRFVIRKATLDLTSGQVRSTFSKAGMAINEALGEYIETSSLTGEGSTAAATITLRVTSSRLSEVLNQLRLLGTVTAEAASGQDVTDAVVDLEARIRNEQRIERELLALVDKRPDAPLKDLMEIRAQLAAVRGLIESLSGQRERIGRLVSLATVLVTIRAADGPKPVVEKAEGISEYFLTSIESAWSSALHALADTTAFLIRVVVGGIVWWILAILGTAMVWKLYRRAMSTLAAEPAPVG